MYQNDIEASVGKDTEYFNIKTNYNGDIVEEWIDGVKVFDPEAPGQLRPKLIGANVQIESMTQELITWKDRYQYERGRYYESKNKLESFLKDNCEDMDTDQVKELADMFDIELTKEVEFVAKLEVRGTIVVPLWTEQSDVFDDIEFSVDTHYGTEGSVDDYTLLEIDEA